MNCCSIFSSFSGRSRSDARLSSDHCIGLYERSLRLLFLLALEPCYAGIPSFELLWLSLFFFFPEPPQKSLRINVVPTVNLRRTTVCWVGEGICWDTSLIRSSTAHAQTVSCILLVLPSYFGYGIAGADSSNESSRPRQPSNDPRV